MIPRNEQETIALFSSIATNLGYKFKTIGTGFPDAILIKDGKEIRVEFEFRARNFVNHKHPVDGADLIICWEDDWPNCPLPVLSLERYITLAKPMPRWRHFLDWLKDLEIAWTIFNRELRAVKIVNNKNLTCSYCGNQMIYRFTYEQPHLSEEANLYHCGISEKRCTHCGYTELKEIFECVSDPVILRSDYQGKEG